MKIWYINAAVAGEKLDPVSWRNAKERMLNILFLFFFIFFVHVFFAPPCVFSKLITCGKKRRTIAIRYR